MCRFFSLWYNPKAIANRLLGFFPPSKFILKMVSGKRKELAQKMYLFCSLLFERHRIRQRDTSPICCFTLQTAFNSQGWARLKLGAGNSMSSPKVSGTSYLSHPLLLPGAHISRNPESKGESRPQSKHSDMEWRHPKTHLTSCFKISIFISINYLLLSTTAP